jgi:hypothetical protein
MDAAVKYAQKGRFAINTAFSTSSQHSKHDHLERLSKQKYVKGDMPRSTPSTYHAALTAVNANIAAIIRSAYDNIDTFHFADISIPTTHVPAGQVVRFLREFKPRVCAIGKRVYVRRTNQRLQVAIDQQMVFDNSLQTPQSCVVLLYTLSDDEHTMNAKVLLEPPQKYNLKTCVGIYRDFLNAQGMQDNMPEFATQLTAGAWEVCVFDKYVMVICKVPR